MGVTTQKELARRLGVSRELVSLILNGKRPVRNELHRRILREGARVGYAPNSAARSLKRGRFNRIACVVMRYGARRDVRSSSHPYLDVITNELADRGYSVIFEPFHLTCGSYEFIEPPKLFAEAAVDGILAVDASGRTPPQVDDRLAAVGAPVVWINRNREDAAASVTCDELAGAGALTRHLIDLGHRRIAYFGPASDHYSSRLRPKGVQLALEQAGLDPPAVILTPSGWVHEHLGAFFELDPLPTALISYGTTAYHALLHLLPLRGLRVPRDLSICSFTAVGEWTPHYPITALEVPEAEMAAAAVRLLLEVIDGSSDPLVPDPIPGRLRLGWSTSPPGEDRGAWNQGPRPGGQEGQMAAVRNVRRTQTERF